MRFSSRTGFGEWTRRSENNLGENRDELLALMRGVAKAENKDDFETALNNLKKKACIGKKAQNFKSSFKMFGWLKKR